MASFFGYPLLTGFIREVTLVTKPFGMTGLVWTATEGKYCLNISFVPVAVPLGLFFWVDFFLPETGKPVGTAS